MLSKKLVRTPSINSTQLYSTIFEYWNTGYCWQEKKHAFNFASNEINSRSKSWAQFWLIGYLGEKEGADIEANRYGESLSRVRVDVWSSVAWSAVSFSWYLSMLGFWRLLQKTERLRLYNLIITHGRNDFQFLRKSLLSYIRYIFIIYG